MRPHAKQEPELTPSPDSGPAPHPAAHDHDADYAALLASLRACYSRAADTGPLFTTHTKDLFPIFLDGLPAEQTSHTCSACRRFVERFGSLVALAESGRTKAALWDRDRVPPFYRPAIAALQAAVERAEVTGVFLTTQAVWGTPTKGGWTHMAVEPPLAHLLNQVLLSPSQAMAAKREDRGAVSRALAEFTQPMLDQAIRLLRADALSQSAKFIGPVEWLRDLATKHAKARPARIADNLIWRAVASAPDGYCHPRASVIGTLLTDIKAGLPFDDIRARFAAKTHPLQYQRPQAEPTAGNIADAERIVAKLGIAKSLDRRFARLDELETLWTPRATTEPAPAADRVFAHLTPKPRDGGAIDMPPIVITWDKFARTVLPGTEAAEFYVPNAKANYMALTTAADITAPPILKWDRADRRNPVAWYVYPGRSPAAQWGLRPDTWCRINAVVPLPTLWGDTPMPFLGEGALLVLDGARDSRDAGNALFPVFLRQELHAVRATLEFYSKSAKLSGRDEATACGFDIRNGQRIDNCLLRTSNGGLWTSYKIDRWD